MKGRDEIALAINADVAVVLYEMIERYYEAAKPELARDRAEWYALVQLSGALERSGLLDAWNYQELLADARSSLADYDGIPF
jgi:hypothetical protein